MANLKKLQAAGSGGFLTPAPALASGTGPPTLFQSPADAPASITTQPEAASRQRRSQATRTQIFTGLDVGTTKMCAIIGQVEPDGHMTILGVGSTPSVGLRRGIVIDMEETIESIRSAIRKAEEIAHVAIHDVFVGIAGGHIQSHNSTGMVEIKNPTRGIGKADIRRVLDRARGLQIPVEREIIHVIPQRFLIDDGPTLNPEGFSSTRLEAEVLIVTAAVTSAQNIVRAVNQAGYRCTSIYLEPLASSLAILSEKEKDLGAIMVDIGGGTSDVAIWVDGAVRFTGVVPFGGDAITEDIAKGLKISRYDAENLKKRYGHAVASKINPEEDLEVPNVLTDRPERISRRFLCEIIQSRVEEILLMTRQMIEATPLGDKVYGGVVLTGGCALLEGIDDVAAKIFTLPAKVGAPSGFGGMSSVVSSPIYSTGVGLVLYGLDHQNQKRLAPTGIFADLVALFRRFIDWYV
jgi:cell division protein FtsA